MTPPHFSTGSIVRTRGRDWVVLPGASVSSGAQLHLRPAAGRAEEETVVSLDLEHVEATSVFPLPSPARLGSVHDARLISHALHLSLRSGAGPLRALGHIACNPYPYQLVPLLMALQMDVVRLLIADGVGLGKTLESGIIARELRDRGDIERITVLSPPRLVSQWSAELRHHLNLPVEEVTTRTATSLQRAVPTGTSLFRHYPLTVVSYDFVKDPLRRDEFARECPEFVIVDEAHTCTGGGQRQNHRYELMRLLAASSSRHLVLCTATPHSGKQANFLRLLGLLDASGKQDLEDEAWLRAHVVQRPRAAVVKGEKDAQLPEKWVRDLTYQVTSAWLECFAEICRDSAAQQNTGNQGLLLGVISLAQALASSPEAALVSLDRANSETPHRRENRAASAAPTSDVKIEDAEEFDIENSLADDFELGAPPLASGAQKKLRKKLELLVSQQNPKFDAMAGVVEHFLFGSSEPECPIVFCRFIKTAQSVRAKLQTHLRGRAEVLLVTSIDQEDVTKATEPRSPEALPRVLVATDLLSEGINLQAAFSCIVHYDLPWNPTRLEQRNGRVDRARQPRPEVRCCTLWATNSPVDAHVLEVLRAKASSIQEQTFVRTLHVSAQSQKFEKFSDVVARFGKEKAKPSADEIWLSSENGGAWRLDLGEASHARFGQETLVPEQIFPELKENQAIAREQGRVQAFFPTAARRLGVPFREKAGSTELQVETCPPHIRAILRHHRLNETVRMRLDGRAAPDAIALTRNHPIVSALADCVLESTLMAADLERPQVNLPSALPRMSIWAADSILMPTFVTLLRLRFELTTERRESSHTALVEEASALAWAQGPTGIRVMAQGQDALNLLALTPKGELTSNVKSSFARQALEVIAQQQEDLAALGRARAEALLLDHTRVHRATASSNACRVRCLPPFDIVGLFVLAPAVGGQN